MKRQSLKKSKVSRAHDRRLLAIPGRCGIGERSLEDVLVEDLSAGGCSLRGSLPAFSKADAVTVWLDTHGPFSAKLRWAKRGSIGVAFESPLDQATIDLFDPPSATGDIVAPFPARR